MADKIHPLSFAVVPVAWVWVEHEYQPFQIKIRLTTVSKFVNRFGSTILRIIFSKIKQENGSNTQRKNKNSSILIKTDEPILEEKKNY